MNAILICLCSMILNWWSSPICIDSLGYSIYMMESSGGINNGRRFEPDFLEKYGDKGLMPKLRRMYGDKAAASSYGNYQVTLLKATETMGDVSPDQLEKPSYNRLVAMTILDNYIQKYGNHIFALEKIYTRWNGSKKYAKKAIKYYFEYQDID